MFIDICIIIITFLVGASAFLFCFNAHACSKKKKKELIFIKNIIELLSKSQQLPKIIGTQKEIMFLDIFEKNFYQKLYEYLLNYKSKEYNIIQKDQLYIFQNIIEIMSLINYYHPELFLTSNFLRCISLLMVEMTKSKIILNNEFVAKIFYGLLHCIKEIKDPIINKEINIFEKDMLLIMKTCLFKFYGDFDSYLDFISPLLKPSNIGEIIIHLNSIIYNLKRQSIFPFYLKGLIEYFEKTQIEKYIIIKIFNYFLLFNTTNYENKSDDYYYYLGYTLYSIIHCIKRPIDLNLKDFYILKRKRLNNGYAKNILLLAIDLLKSKSIQEFKEILEKKNINCEVEYPKISDNFDDDDKYYEDLYKQLIYSIRDCINKKSLNYIIPFQQEAQRALWLSYIEILLICLREDEKNNNKIKVIFYFIVNIFSTQLEPKSLEFCNDIIPLLFLESIKQIYIFEFPEIYKLFDSEYSEYYSHLDDNSKFDFGLSNYLYDLIDSDIKYKEYIKKETAINCEINNLKKFHKYLPFPIICDYIQDLDIPFSLKYKILFTNNGLKFLYKNSYNYIDIENKKILFKNFPSNINNINSYEALLNLIIKDANFIKLLKEIMKSKVVKQSYTLINKWYLNKGKFDLKKESEKTEDEKTNPKGQNQKNIDEEISEEFISDDDSLLINKKPIIYYYNKFCHHELSNLDYSKIFIIMRLPSVIKGFTFRFLKIILNCNGIEFKINNEKENTDKENELIKAYLVFVILYVQNHFIKRNQNKGINFNLFKTPNINNVKEGGEQLIDLLFGDILINNCINQKQANYILDINNWKNKSLYQFRNDFIKITKDTTESTKESSIIYLRSYRHSICDHSKLSI